jgi:hypothetical protein
VIGWLKRRRIKEQKMLLYQNGIASEGSLFGYFFDDASTLALLSRTAAENREIGLSQIDGHALALDKVERLLALNMELRRLYDSTASRHVADFDKAHTPLGGWDFYLSRNE